MQVRWLIPLLACTLGASILLHAQSRDSAMVGTISDSSGAVVPGARVTVTNAGTGETFTYTTGESGEYVVLNLLYGDYRIQVEKSGFKTSTREGVRLQIGQRAKLDFTLTPGAVSETVEVAGTAPLLETQQATVGQVIDSKKVLDLPLNGRNWLQLATLAPGVVAPRTTTGPGYQAGSAITVNGNPADANNFSLDGVDNNAPLVNAQNIDPTIDSIQEFRIESNNSAAEYGRAAAQVSVATRSGTNELHGSAYEFLRNDRLDARNFFDSTGRIPPLRQNNFGATLGGHILRDKTFYFLSYDGIRVRNAQTARGIIPSKAFLSGDFSSLGQTVHDPYGNPLDGNRIPESQISPTAKALLAYYPEPNFVDPVFNYIRIASGTQRVDQGIARIDHRFNDRDLLFVRTSLRNGETTSPGLFAIGIGGANATPTSQNLGLSHSHIFSPNQVNTLRLGYNRYGSTRIPEGYGKDFGSAVLPPPVADRNFGFISFSLSGYSGIGFGDREAKQPENTYQVVDTYSWIRGTHSFKFGLDIRRWQSNFSESFSYNMGFDGRFTGSPIADMLYGTAASAFSFDGNFQQHLRRWDQAYFVQDDWRVTPTLTVNYGLRYEYVGPISDAQDNLSSFDYTDGRIINVGTQGYPTGHNRTYRDLNNFGPRLGIAWSPARLPNTVFRMAYGMFYVTAEGQSDLVLGPKTSPFYYFSGTVTDPTALSFDNPAPIGTIAGGYPSVSAADLHLRTPYVHQWSFTIQRQLPHSILIEAGYIGNKGTKLWTIHESNAARPGVGPVQPRKPYPTFGSIEVNEGNNNSTYNGLQMKFEKRYGAGMSLLASYTFSKATDYASFVGNRLFNPYNFGQDRGLADHDVRHRFSGGWLYELPFGRNGALWKTSNAVANQVAGGWSLGAIMLFETGMPFTVWALGDPGNWGGGARPDIAGAGKIDNPTLSRWFNTAAFVNPAAYTLGTAGRNILSGPGINNWDVIVMKNFDFSERQRLQFRGEFFNAFNHPSFGNPGSTLGVASFGVISGATPGRIIQLGLKYRF